MAAAQASSEDVIATVAAASGISAKDAEATVVAASEAMMAAVSMTAGEAPFSKENPVTIKVGASPVPHAAMLEAIKDDLAEMGVVVEIVEFTDYVLLLGAERRHRPTGRVSSGSYPDV